MSAESITYAALHAAAGVAALVSTRVKPGLLPQGTDLPAIVYVRAETEYITTIHSAAARGSRVVMDIWCIAETFTAAEAIGDAVEAAIAVAGLAPVGRRPDIDPDTEAFSTIISCVVWT